jgi:hypothetical protein
MFVGFPRNSHELPLSHTLNCRWNVLFNNAATKPEWRLLRFRNG